MNCITNIAPAKLKETGNRNYVFGRIPPCRAVKRTKVAQFENAGSVNSSRYMLRFLPFAIL